MSTLDSLIRLHRWQLDERRRQLAELDQLAHKLREELVRLDEDKLTEQQIAGASEEAAFTYGGYARAIVEKRRKLLQSQVETEQQALRAREALADAYQEVKRYEIAAANRLLQQHRRSEQRQQRTMDELAAEGFRRRTTS